MATLTEPRKRKRLTACYSQVQKEVISFREVRNLTNQLRTSRKEITSTQVQGVL